MRHKPLKFSCLLLLLLLAGCSVGPDYKPIVMPVPAKYKELPAGWKQAEPKDDMHKGKWWLIFKDPYLNNLMDQVNISNQTIAQAVAQYKEALATVAQTSAAFWPTVDVNALGQRQKSAANPDGVNIISSNLYNTYSVEPSISWAPDIFGVIRRAVEAAEAGAQATEAQLEETRLSTQALLAQTYFQLRAADLTQKLLDDTVTAYRQDLQITKNKYAAGVDSDLDITQAETQLQNAITAALDNGIDRAQYEHAIAVLINKLPEQFSIKSSVYDLSVPPVPMELPSMLLERRADVAAAERSVAQANAEIGVAIAAYFPIVTLTADYGYSSTHWRQLFSPANIVWSFGAAIAETIFDGGSRAAGVQLARATYDQKVAAYKQTVLAAFQNVEDNLVAVRILDSEVTVQQAAVTSAARALQITLNQYNAGIAEYLAVVIEQGIYYSAKATEIDIYSRRLVATVGLIQALGGGWNVSELNTDP